MNWETCLEKSVYERQPNPQEAKSLLKMAKIRFSENKKQEPSERNTFLIVESYWETIKLITGILTLKGYKSYSQECLVEFLKKFQDIKESRINKIDQLRRLRNDIDYRGKFLDLDYLERNKKKIEKIIEELKEILETELEKKK